MTQRIRGAIKRLVLLEPHVGRHLEQSIRTGHFCAYEPTEPLDWDLG